MLHDSSSGKIGSDQPVEYGIVTADSMAGFKPTVAIEVAKSICQGLMCAGSKLEIGFTCIKRM